MKSAILTLVVSILAFGATAQATCNQKEEKALATARVIATLNGLKEIELSRPEAHSEKYGTFTVTVSGVQNGFFMQGSAYEITISDDGFCSLVSFKRGLTLE